MNIRANFEELSRGVIGSYERYNGFYRRAGMRKIIYELYDGKCAMTGQPISLEDADIGHIVPRSRPEIFGELYPSLDVDNAVNLHLLASWVNKRNNDAFLPSPLAIHNAVSFSAKLVSTKMDAILHYADGVDISALRQNVPSNDLAAVADLDLYDNLLTLLSTAGGKYLFAAEDQNLIGGKEGLERLEDMFRRMEQSLGGCLKIMGGECVGVDHLEVPKGIRISSVYRDAVQNDDTGFLFRREQLIPLKNHMESNVIPFYQARYKTAGATPASALS